MANQDHLKLLLGGAKDWNKWRGDNPGKKPLFAGAELSGADLKGVNLSGADLSRADLTASYLNGANLRDANLSGTNFRSAYLHGADLTGANLCEANLLSADLGAARLTGTNLTRAHLVDTNFEGATIADCSVYGIAAWNVSLAGASQSNLLISPPNEPAITVDDLKVAQFIYLLLNNAEIRDVINTVNSKAVLLLGRFTPSHKAVLYAIKEKLRQLNFVPIIFDFARPADRDLTETVKVLAGLSLFVVADLTNPKSIPLELQALVPDYAIPFVPIQHESDEPFSMSGDLKKYHWVLPPVRYNTTDQLLRGFEAAVVRRALKKHDELVGEKAEQMRSVHISDFLSEEAP